MAEKTIDIASPILSRNERLADQLRQRFKETNTYVINVLSSPGSGKTTTILGTNERLRDKAGLRRLFLHAASLEFALDDGRTPYTISAPLAPELREVLDRL